MKHNIEALKRALPLSELLHRYGVDLQANGSELKACCPFHNENTPSFSVFNKGDGERYFCFGCGVTGDQIQFIADMHNLNPREAIERFAEMAGGAGAQPVTREALPSQKSARPSDWIQSIAPSPDYPAPVSVCVNLSGQWTDCDVVAAWPYRDADGQLIGYDCRIEPETGKQIIPVKWQVNTATGEARWKQGALDKPRSVYGLELIAANPKHQILITEGCKAADAARRMIKGSPIVVISWQGGAKAIDHTDWSVLAGRKVVCWPDCDSKTDPKTGGYIPFIQQPGMSAMLRIAEILDGHGAAVRIIEVPPAGQIEDGWDAADADFNREQCLEFIKSRIRSHAEILERHPLPAAASEHVATAGSRDSIPDITYAHSDEYPDEYLQKSSYDDYYNEHAESTSPKTPRLATRHNVDHWSPLSEVNGKNKPISTIDNFAEMLDRIGAVVRYNVISKEREIIIPGEGFSIDNQSNASLACLISWCGRFSMPIGQVDDFLTYLSDRNPYNPVSTWILSNPWDGINRLNEFFDTVTAKNEKHDDNVLKAKRAMMKRWMLSAIAAAFSPKGVSAHGVLVFQGDQYLGKTKWFKHLVPSDLGVIADGLILRPDDKDSVKQAVSNWLVELGELDATFRKSDIAQLKSFLTRDRDVIRRAYARLESSYARRTVFFASVNPKEFLHDPTGNRRYWTIECEDINHSHDLDMQQVWAQVHMLYLTGESWFLSEDEMTFLNDANKSFEVVDPIAERIRTRLAWDDSPMLWNWKTATDILIDIGIEKPTQAEATRAANVIRALNGNQGKRVGTGRLLLAPNKIYGS